MLIFGNRLKELRENENLTQQELADIIEVNGKQIISGYENGKSEPDLTLLTKIANYFNVSVDYLLGRTSFKSSKSEANFYNITSSETLNLLSTEGLELQYKEDQNNYDKLIDECNQFLKDTDKDRLIYNILNTIDEVILKIDKNHLFKTDLYKAISTCSKIILQIQQNSLKANASFPQLYENLVHLKNQLTDSIENDLIKVIVTKKLNQFS